MLDFLFAGGFEKTGFGVFLQNSVPNLIMFFIKIVLALVVFIIGAKIIKKIKKGLSKSLTKYPEEAGTVQFFNSMISVGCYILLIALIALIFGITTTAIASLLGSIAITIGLGLQGSLSNFAGGFIIVFFKPFKVGDYIVINSLGQEGFVTEIQIFYTKLRTFDNTIIILPNSKLTDTTVINNSFYEERRMESLVPVAYKTDIDLAKRVIKEELEKYEDISKSHDVFVYINEFSDSSIILGVRFYVKSADYYGIKVLINDRIKKILNDYEISIPFNQLEITMLNK